MNYTDLNIKVTKILNQYKRGMLLEQEAMEAIFVLHCDYFNRNADPEGEYPQGDQSETSR